jgi:hypothetical protein
MRTFYREILQTVSKNVAAASESWPGSVFPGMLPIVKKSVDN